MPGAVPAIVTGVAGLGSALISNSASNRAARYQADANRQAMALERERMAEEKRRYDQEYEANMAQRRLRDQIARQILAEHGINVPGPAAAAPAGKSAGAHAAGASVPAGGTLQGFRASLLALSPGATGATVEGPPAGPVAGAMGGYGNGTASPMFDSQGGPAGVLGGAPGMLPPPSGSLGDLTNWSDQIWKRGN